MDHTRSRDGSLMSLRPQSLADNKVSNFEKFLKDRNSHDKKKSRNGLRRASQYRKNAKKSKDKTEPTEHEFRGKD